METRIGKIKEISVGLGGYQDAMLGLSITLGSDKECWGVGDFKGTWEPSIECSSSCRWTEEERRAAYADTMVFIGSLLTKAKKNEVSKLKGTPVEVVIDGHTLKSWRVLEEVI